MPNTIIVIGSSVKTDTDSDNRSQTHSIVNIQYDALNGETRTLNRQYLKGEYREGAHIALRCTEDHTEAVPESATQHDPVFLLILFFAALLSGLIGFFLLSGCFPAGSAL